METFIQFYDYGTLVKSHKVLWLRNSFSSVWKVIKERGSIIWIDPSKDFFPDINGIVYITCDYIQEIIYTEKWARLRPDLKFIVGGPGVIYSGYPINVPNIKFEKRKMYELLDVFPTEDLWNLEPPIEIKDYLHIYYNYALSYGHRCYWGKCTFCKTNLQEPLILDVKHIPLIKPGDVCGIWLNTQAITPKNVLDIFPNLEKDPVYGFYMRGDKPILEALNKIKDVTSVMPLIGLELPSNRMLKLMNKGTDLETMIDVIGILSNKGCKRMILAVINGWPNLEESDIKETEYFLDKISPFKDKILCMNNWLYRYQKEENTTCYKTLFNKPYYVYNLNKEQQELNDKVFELYTNFGFKAFLGNLSTKPGGKVEMTGMQNT